MSWSTNATRSAGASVSKHDEHGETDRIGHHRLVLGVDAVAVERDRLGQVRGHGLLASRRARTQHVQAHACDDRRQPSAEVLDVARVGAAETEPGLLDRVVGLVHRAEHPMGHRSQIGSVGLETLRQPLVVLHPSRLPFVVRHSIDGTVPVDVTSHRGGER
jgi:hypothetical protein